MRLVFLGPPGAGKGTQADRLAEHLGIPHIATGDMMRAAREEDSPLGRMVREYMDHGDLVPDEVANEVALERLRRRDAADGFILDGYPRTMEQADTLDAALDQMGTKIDRAIKFMITKDEIVKRLSGRRICPTCHSVYHVYSNPPKVEGVCDLDGTQLIQREDDSESSVINRLEKYGAQTKPLYDLYSERGLLVEVDAIGSSDEVFERLTEALSL